MNNSKLIGDFEILRDHCILIRRSYNTYTDLYNKENRDLLDKVAPAFFSDIAERMQRDWIMQSCKLMDPAQTKVKGQIFENITIELINKQLEAIALFSQSIQDISNEILEYGKKF